MKKTFFLKLCFLLLAFKLSSTSVHGKASGFVINGKVEGLNEGAVLYLIKVSTKDTVGKAIYRHNNFKFKGIVPKGTEFYFLRLDSTISSKRSQDFLLVNDLLSISGNLQEWPKIKLTGSKPQQEYAQFLQIWNSFKDQILQITDNKNIALQALAIAERDKDSTGIRYSKNLLSSLKEELRLTQERRNTKVKEYIFTHLNSLFIPDLIKRMDGVYDLAQRLDMYNSLTEKAKSCYFGELLKEDLEIAKRRNLVKEGALIPDFNLASIDGQSMTIREFASLHKLTLIDFWAVGAVHVASKYPI